MTEVDRSLLGQLTAINESLCSATKVMAELVLQEVGGDDVSGVSTADLRVIGRRLVAAGGDLTSLGVEMGVVADQIERD